MITIYATHACAKCKQLAGSLRNAGVEFHYMYVGEDITKEQLCELVGRDVRMVPVVVDEHGTELEAFEYLSQLGNLPLR